MATVDAGAGSADTRSVLLATFGLAAAMLVSAAGPAPAHAAPPPPSGEFHIQFTGRLQVPASATVVEIDGDVSRRVIRDLHREGRYVICYMSAGSRESWRSDAGDFPRKVIGRPLDGWPGERWLDIRRPAVMGIMVQRIGGLSAKGCDGVEFDNVDGYANPTGFPLTRRDQVRYNRALANEAQAQGMSPGLKNAVGLIARLEPSFGWALNEECVTYRECDHYRPFVDAGKPVYVLEYGEVSMARVCRVAHRYELQAQVKRLRLDAWASRC